MRPDLQSLRSLRAGQRLRPRVQAQFVYADVPAEVFALQPTRFPMRTLLLAQLLAAELRPLPSRALPLMQAQPARRRA